MVKCTGLLNLRVSRLTWVRIPPPPHSTKGCKLDIIKSMENKAVIVALGFIILLLLAPLMLSTYSQLRESSIPKDHTPVIQDANKDEDYNSHIPTDKYKDRDSCRADADCGSLNCLQQPCPDLRCINGECVTVR